MSVIPVYQPSLSGNEKKYVNDCLDSNWISSKGKFISEFEEKFAEYIGVKYATTVSNGTVALHLALLALGVGPGDEVIVPTLTYIASVNAISYTGACPVFVDSLENTWQMSPDDVRSKITSKTRAIMTVHLYGHPCEMSTLLAIAKEYNLFLIEDCAEAIGSRYNNQSVGSFGDIATFSFYGNKTITTGEGGMVVTNDRNLHARAIHFKGQGLDATRQYWHDVIGYNYRMTNICAAIGLAQLEQIDSFISQKRQIAQWYQHGLKDLPVQFHQESQDIFHSYWMYSILVLKAQQRDSLREHLSCVGVETRPVFYPAHTMPMYLQKAPWYKVAEDLGQRGINLPTWPGLDRASVDFICGEITKFFG